MMVKVEILRWDGGEQPTLLHVLSHDCHSLETVRAAVQAVIDAPDVLANGYRIVTENGDELFGSAQRSFGRNDPEIEIDPAAHRKSDCGLALAGNDLFLSGIGWDRRSYADPSGRMRP
jgi:hypothetical protein